ncbi:hypothetical protein MMC21_004679 [Puttea exsequens]|nr:hypothetical protein [Puttea exsequens]
MSFCDCTSSYLLPRVTELNGQTVTLLSNHDAFMALDSAIYHSPCPFTELTQAGKKIMVRTTQPAPELPPSTASNSNRKHGFVDFHPQVQTQTAEYCGPIEFVPPALDGPILYTAPPPRKARDVPTETPAVTAAPIALSVLLERPYRD